MAVYPETLGAFDALRSNRCAVPSPQTPSRPEIPARKIGILAKRNRQFTLLPGSCPRRIIGRLAPYPPLLPQMAGLSQEIILQTECLRSKTAYTARTISGKNRSARQTIKLNRTALSERTAPTGLSFLSINIAFTTSR